MAQKTLFVTHPDCMLHTMGGSHPESPQRLAAIVARLEASGLMASLEAAEAPALMDDAPILRAHDKELWASIVEAAPSLGMASVSPEAIMCPGTLMAIRRGAGGAILSAERVVSGRNPNAFVAVRPPGHHATRSSAMGFCFVNNAAVAAYHALDALGLSRVAIVDIDVHHGNGTEDVVAGDPRLYMASTYGAGIYPGNGAVPLGPNMSNVGLAPGSSGRAMRALAEARVFPALEAFAPELVVVSAGYDAHRDDPLGNQSWDDEDYHWWFQKLQQLANTTAGGRLVAVLEGGYEVEALSRCVERSIRAMQEGSGQVSAT